VAVARAETMTDLPPPAPARFHPWNLMLWTALALPLAAGIAVVSMQVQSHGFAPAGVLSVLVGLLLGILLAWVARLTAMGHRRSGLVAALVAAGITVAGQHQIAYRDYQQAYLAAEQSSPELALVHAANPDFGPVGLGEFLRVAARGGHGWLWLLDAILITASTLFVVNCQLRQPYCDQCRGWYRTIQRGPLTPDRAARLATEIGIDLPSGPLRLRYRLQACRSGCGPTGFELSWTSGSGLPGLSHRWLSPSERHTVVTHLAAEQKGTSAVSNPVFKVGR
jgi:hypothetical protein